MKLNKARNKSAQQAAKSATKSSGMSGNRQKVIKAIERDVGEQARDIAEGSRNVLSAVGQAYLKALVDTPAAGDSGIPSNSGGYPQKTSIIKLRCEGDFYNGINGMGFVSANPGLTSWQSSVANSPSVSQAGGPFSNVTVAVHTPLNSTLTGIPHPFSGGIGLADVRPTTWANAPWAVPGVGHTGDVLWRQVGSTLEVFPNSSLGGTATAQSGDIALLETPGHVDPGIAQPMDVAGFQTMNTTRIVRGIDIGGTKEKIVVNHHPLETALAANSGSSGASFVQSDFAFNDSAGGSAQRIPQFGGGGVNVCNRGPLVVQTSGTPGSSYHFTLTTMFEVKGRIVQDLEARVVDGRAMDLIQNALATKILSGYVGSPPMVEKSYFTQIAAVASAAGDVLWKKGKEWLGNAAHAALAEFGGFGI
jgi:hypothetical protein